MYGIIYKATNIQNNKVYIGQTIRSLEERIYYHYYRAKNELDITHTHFINAIRKYGENSFQWEIIDTAENQDELNEKEKHWIQYYNSINEGYNMCEGGNDSFSEKFLLACNAKPFLVYKTNGEYVGEFLSARDFSRQYGIHNTIISDLLNNKYNSSNGIIAIRKEEFNEDVLKNKILKAKNSYRPFIAIKLSTMEQIGPFSSMKECKEQLQLKSNHIGEVLKGQRKSQEGYIFKFID